MNVGLTIGIAGIARDVQDDVNSPSAKIAANTSFAYTYDYYFHKSGSGSSFTPYVGAGLKYYSLANVEIYNTDNNLPDGFSPAVNGKMGGLIRAGFEWGKFRMGLEYNLLPDSDLEDLNDNIVGTAKNGYLGIHIGFFVGGGKWGKKAE